MTNPIILPHMEELKLLAGNIDLREPNEQQSRRKAYNVDLLLLENERLEKQVRRLKENKLILMSDTQLHSAYLDLHERYDKAIIKIQQLTAEVAHLRKISQERLNFEGEIQRMRATVEKYRQIILENGIECSKKMNMPCNMSVSTAATTRPHTKLVPQSPKLIESSQFSPRQLKKQIQYYRNDNINQAERIIGCYTLSSQYDRHHDPFLQRCQEILDQSSRLVSSFQLS